MKKFILTFMYREAGILQDRSETIQCKSKSQALRYGKTVASNNQWRLLDIREEA